MKKKRNPQDATLRNIRALKKRVESLENCVTEFIKFIVSELYQQDLLEILHPKKRGKK